MPETVSIQLEASLEDFSEQGLTISYELKNGRATPVYVFNLLYETDPRGERTLNPELGYCYEDEGTIRVGKFLVPIPPGIKAESPAIPYLDPLPPEASLKSKIRLALPLRRFHPYYPVLEEGDTAQTSRLKLTIGLLDPSRAGPKDALISPARGAGEGHFVCDYGLGIQYQELCQKVLQAELLRYYVEKK